MKRYNPKDIEPRWQKIWRQSGIYKTDMARIADKYYTIPMLPYPSGDLHIGHWYNFGPADTVARWHRMLGQNVLTAMGFDGFGLPAENAAIQRNIPPAEWTRNNIQTMTKQIDRIGASYDWDHAITTNEPEYYRWNQWLFLQLYKHGLAYRAKAIVNWCPKDQTVLANEQVVGEKNVCERCGTPVIQKEMESWYFKITDFAERLLDDLGKVDWPERVKTMQINWIGKSQGVLIDFKVDGRGRKIQIFTTRPDTIFGATYMVLAPEHSLIDNLTTEQQKPEISQYLAEAGRKTELERKAAEKNKTGVFTGSYATNPATKKKIPIWVADYVLMSYGTGAIMAVPAHDERDYDFAKKYDLPIREVIEPAFIQDAEPGKVRPDQPFVEREAITAIVRHWSEDKYIGLKWKEVDWETLITGGVEKGQTLIEAAIAEIAEETGYKNPKFIKELGKNHAKFFHVPKNENRFAHFSVLYFELENAERLNVSQIEKKRHQVVWLSREDMSHFHLPGSHRYAWNQLVGKSGGYNGEGIMVNSGKYNGWDSSAAREQIVKDLAMEGLAKEQTNYRLRDWLISRQRYWGTPIPVVYCSKCGTQPVPEADLPIILPEAVEFLPTGQSPLIKDGKFVNTKCPNCGGPAKRETDTMDTFVDSSWYFLRYIDNKNRKAIFDTSLVNAWMPVDHYIGGIEHAILHLLYARFVTKFLHDHYGLKFDEPFKKLTNQGVILGPDGHKMSKSRGNVVNPDEQVDSYGADSLRLYMMFMGPYDQGGPYNLGGIAGTRRFLDRLWVLMGEFLEAEPTVEAHLQEAELAAATHRTIKKVTRDLEELSFNTAIAAMMALVNDLYKFKAQGRLYQSPGWRQAIETLIQLLAPFAPHISEEMWQMLGHESSAHISSWPLWDEKLVHEETFTMAVQINGKLRGEVMVPAGARQEEAEKIAKEDPKIAAQLAGKQIRKVVYVPDRLMNLVI